MINFQQNGAGLQGSQTGASNKSMSHNGGMMSKEAIVEGLRNIDKKRREAKEKLDLEIFNHYFLNFTGNG